MKSYKQLKKSERLELCLLKEKGYYQKDIAKVLGVSPGTISRELKRNKVLYITFRRRKWKESGTEKRIKL